MSKVDDAPEPLSVEELLVLSNLLVAMKQPLIKAVYTNWRGETSMRVIRPKGIWFGSTEWHPEPCLLLTAHDVNKGEDRDFRLSDFDISSIAAV
jgi:predicted DNA-binding transcriptional regulator YafY